MTKSETYVDQRHRLPSKWIWSKIDLIFFYGELQSLLRFTGLRHHQVHSRWTRLGYGVPEMNFKVIYLNVTDGPGDPLNATAIAKALINELDGGGYHPVSLALNCENHYFEEYSSGADVVLQDACMRLSCYWRCVLLPYLTYLDPIGINATFSTVYNTPCTL